MRLIDADKLFDDLLKMWGEEVDVWICDMFMKTVNAAPTITQPPNDPLTLEELREMDGEPVWVVGISSINDFLGHWDICNLGGDSPLFPYCGEDPDINLYGITWKVYRRKPEEGTT